jgi:Fe2+ transport system protein FeoA
MMTVTPVPLTQLNAGETARLYEAHLDPDCLATLRALGLNGAAVLRVCRRGDPCIIQVRATRIGLSHRVAERVFVIAGPTGRCL